MSAPQHTISTVRTTDVNAGSARIDEIVEALSASGTGTIYTSRVHAARVGSKIVETMIKFVSGPVVSQLDQLEDQRIANAKTEIGKKRRGPWGVFVRETINKRDNEVKTIVFYTASSKQVSLIKATVKAALKARASRAC